jgi:hypothetical protein
MKPSKSSTACIEILESRQLLTTLQVEYSLFGDSNLDGTVNAVDFNALATHFGNQSSVWATGDFNYDGVVNSLDFGQLATSYGPVMSLSELVKLPVIKGDLVGTYKIGSHKFPLSLVVTSHTHTGHFSGTMIIRTGSGDQTAGFSGKVTSALHVHIDFAGNGFSGTLTGATTHTGGQISGSFSVTGDFNGTGTYKVFKP